MPDVWAFERGLRARGAARIAGVDEAGRGPLAGPVVAAAVILPEGFSHPGVRDSKLLSQRARTELAGVIRSQAVAWSLGEASAGEVDRINVLQATLRAMERALAALAERPGYVLVDGPRLPFLLCPGEAVVRGDRTVGVVAAASILAKVHRDAVMDAHHERWPQYGFARNRGYGTAAHLAALARHGPCPIHRRSFRGVSPSR